MKNIFKDLIAMIIITGIGYGAYSLMTMSPIINSWINENIGVVIMIMLILVIILWYLGLKFILWKIDKETERF